MKRINLNSVISTNNNVDGTQSPSNISSIPRPQDDFYRFINGEWLQTYQLPADRARYGSFDRLDDESKENVRAILEDSSHPAPKGSILYNQFLDIDTLNKLSLSPLLPLIKKVHSTKTKEEFAQVLGELEVKGGPSIFGIDVSADPGNPNTNIIHISQSGLGLPDEVYYREPQYESIRTAYIHMLEEFFTLLSSECDCCTSSSAPTDAQNSQTARANAVFELEKQIAHFHWDNVTDRDSEKTYNPFEWDKLEALYGDFPIKTWIQGWQTAYDSYNFTLDSSSQKPLILQNLLKNTIVHEPSFIQGLSTVWNQTSLDTLISWEIAHLLISAAPYLSENWETTSFNFYGKTLVGTPKMKERWKRGVALTNNTVGEEIGKEYVKRHFPADSKEQVKKLVGFLIQAYHLSISNSTWLSEETKKKALDKLALFTPMIGYPDKWRDYSALAVTADKTLIENLQMTSSFETAFQLSKAGKPVDKTEWLMNAQQVNAYYEPTQNVIVFPAAILQPPFFDPNVDPATNFGGIGAVIGHEIGHGFDDQGSRYDGEGRLHNWWTPQDRENFDKLTHALIAQYNALVPLQLEKEYAAKGKPQDAPHVNGALTIGENIGDLSGVTISLKAYLISLGQTPATAEEVVHYLEQSPEIDGKTAAQRFFISYATIWKTKERDAFMEQMLTVDPHSPAEFRANQILRNIPSFMKAYDVKPDDTMWMDPSQQVSIW